MTIPMLPLSEDMKKMILEEHPDGLWIVLEEDFRHLLTPEDVALPGHPMTASPAG